MVVVLVLLMANMSFYEGVLNVYPLQRENIAFLLSLVGVLGVATFFVLRLFSTRWTVKPLLMLVLIVSSLSAYFMDTYHVVINSEMIRNVMQTNLSESMDLFSVKQVLYLVFLGVLPAYLVYKMPLTKQGLKQGLWAYAKGLVLSLLLIILLILAFSKHYTSFFREHKPLRYNANPVFWMYSIGEYIAKTYRHEEIVLKKIGEDAKVIDFDEKRPKLLIMVVGEAARADHFALNGYAKPTTPYLEKEDIINFPRVSSCGTATAASVPCMFSMYTRSDYSYTKGISTENVLDVLVHTGQVEVLWRDNNSDSKGVALRVPYENFKDDKINTLCEGECRDVGMLVGLDSYITSHPHKDIMIVLHQMGNHGPAYYKRYAKSFEKFVPTCESNQLESCTKEAIANAYDNAILYTDYFLFKVIGLLRGFSETHESAMFYMSDHGESLGENGIYLHGLPYFMAPKAQTHIAALMWFGGEKPKIDNEKSYSHDALFHTILGFFNVHTTVYDSRLDILHQGD